ncbi:MAG TPA: TIGR00730 family Rossman fold protein [Acidobacteriaceae bacterium]|nr:TIGR00730 family Rossman fold protein [Acidobacteriaceae bacterium]
MGESSQRRICVFCGSNIGARLEYRAEAVALGKLLGETGIGLVYGGAQVGLMGAMADSALENGGQVLGVIPRALAGVEVAHQRLTRLVLVETMHERKALMAREADAFVALPGAFGTLDEFFEILTWAQLGIHEKPCALINTAGYFDHLLTFLQSTVNEGFLKPKNYALIQVAQNAGEALRCIQKRWQTLPVIHAAPAEPAP